MLTLCILGFLADEPLHAYELRARISDLTGYTRPVSDGALYPAVDRLLKAGYLTRHQEPAGGAAPRQILTLTAAGRAELMRRLAEPAPTEITDGASFMTLLAFLRHLDDADAQVRVLRSRLAFLEQPASFFYHRDRRPQRAAETTDRFRKGMVTIAAASRQASIAWLRQTLAELETPGRPTKR